MFLTEGKTLYKRGRISASPSTGWQMLYESEMVWNKLEMGMTRLEHSAIVREDTSLLQEGVKEFFTKAKKWFQWAGQEFLRYLDKVIDTWVNIQNKIRTWLVNVEDLKKKVKDKTFKVSKAHKAIIEAAQRIAQSADAVKSRVDAYREAADKAAKENDGDYNSTIKIKDIDDEFKDPAAWVNSLLGTSNADINSYEDAEPVDSTWMTKAINFAKDGRVKCIKTLQYARNSFAKLINMGIRSSDAEKEDVKTIKRASSNMRELLNKWISMINKATNAVISAIGKGKKVEKQEETPKQGDFKWF